MLGHVWLQKKRDNKHMGEKRCRGTRKCSNVRRHVYNLCSALDRVQKTRGLDSVLIWNFGLVFRLSLTE